MKESEDINIMNYGQACPKLKAETSIKHQSYSLESEYFELDHFCVTCATIERIIMGKKKSQNNFKTKTYRKEERRKKKLLKSQRRADKRQKQKIERGLTDICSNLVKLGIDQGIKNFVKSDQNQTKELDTSWKNYKNSMDNLTANENMPLNSTSQFLLDNGLSLSDVTLQSKISNRKKERKSRKKTRKNFSMVKL